MKTQKKTLPFEITEPAFEIKVGKAPAGAILVMPMFKDQAVKTLPLSGEGKSLLEEFVKSKTFQGKSSEICDLSARGLIVFGLGAKEAFHPDTIAGQMIHIAPKLLKYEKSTYVLRFTEEVWQALKGFRDGKVEPAEDDESFSDYFAPMTDEELLSQCVSSLLAGSDSMEMLKSKKKSAEKKTVVYVEAEYLKKKLADAVARGVAVGELSHSMRYVESLPGNFFHPEAFQTYTEQLTRKHGVSLKVFGISDLEKMGCGGIVSVGKGSRIPPRMMILEYKPKNAKNKKPIVLAGKGITFDTGGISLKPAGEMHEMKYDMCGSAIVIHALALAARRKLPVHITGIVAIAENMPGGNAIKPGDVFTAYNGVTVEIQNTDAEGRLVLADILSYACAHLKPGVLFDFATLTGACVVALGHETAGVMTPDDELADRIDRTSRRSLDRTWRLPHWRQYGQGLKSEVADLRNVSGRDGGTITAFRFLSKFVQRSVPWAHFDIAGIAWHSKGYGTRTKGASGWGLSFLNRYFEDEMR
ncbi:MAG: leucyl aminopeptidase [Leptospirales bacterium]|nr:leucyl aminopeptidase [Leptospirales bacterium]HNL02065.1 leucyl aminopeptidase [Leptospiraceae bacterium]